MEYSELTDAQKARARECKTPEELVALAQEEGVELSDAQLEAVSGGGWNDSCPTKDTCPTYEDYEDMRQSKARGYGGASGDW